MQTHTCSLLVIRWLCFCQVPTALWTTWPVWSVIGLYRIWSGAGLTSHLQCAWWVFNALIYSRWFSFFSDVFPQGVFLFHLINYKPLVYNSVYVYPWWGEMLGWFLALSSMLCIPLTVLFKLLHCKGTLMEVGLHKLCFFIFLTEKCARVFKCSQLVVYSVCVFWVAFVSLFSVGSTRPPPSGGDITSNSFHLRTKPDFYQNQKKIKPYSLKVSFSTPKNTCSTLQITQIQLLYIPESKTTHTQK